MSRRVVAQMWAGPRFLRDLAPDEPDPDAATLGALASALTPQNNGVRPVVRVLEQSTIPAIRRGAAGNLPL